MFVYKKDISCSGFTYAMFPELFDHTQAEDVGHLCVHRETGGQDVSILTHKERKGGHDAASTVNRKV